MNGSSRWLPVIPVYVDRRHDHATLFEKALAGVGETKKNPPRIDLCDSNRLVAIIWPYDRQRETLDDKGPERFDVVLLDETKGNEIRGRLEAAKSLSAVIMHREKRLTYDNVDVLVTFRMRRGNKPEEWIVRSAGADEIVFTAGREDGPISVTWLFGAGGPRLVSAEFPPTYCAERRVGFLSFTESVVGDTFASVPRQPGSCEGLTREVMVKENGSLAAFALERKYQCGPGKCFWKETRMSSATSPSRPPQSRRPSHSLCDKSTTAMSLPDLSDADFKWSDHVKSETVASARPRKAAHKTGARRRASVSDSSEHWLLDDLEQISPVRTSDIERKVEALDMKLTEMNTSFRTVEHKLDLLLDIVFKQQDNHSPKSRRGGRGGRGRDA